MSADRTLIDTPTSVAAWRALLLARVAAGHRFAALVGTDIDGALRLTALTTGADGIDALDVLLPADVDEYSALTPQLPAAFWYERELHDLFGVIPRGHPRLDPLVLPLSDPATRPRPGAAAVPGAIEPDETSLPRQVLGAGLFTIPHGPVRSGVFESIEYLVETPGEDVLHPQIRVFYKHRGLEKRFEGMTVEDGVLLAERVEGIASVAHALGFAHAVEEMADTDVPAPAGQVRVIFAELERIANHLDVAMRLADAAGLAVATARFGLHKERVMRLVSRLCGNRFGRGVIVPGGVSRLPDLPPAELMTSLHRLEHDIRGDERELMGTSSFLDRLRGTGRLDGELAARHGALGPIGRACGIVEDARTHRPYDGYRVLVVPTPAHLPGGDAMARLRVRWEEVHAGFALIGAAVEELSATAAAATAPVAPIDAVDGRGIGWAEAPQGELLYVVETVDGRIVRCKPRSASFHNLVLFHSAFHGDVLTDFPFIEASFGLSPAGVVL